MEERSPIMPPETTMRIETQPWTVPNFVIGKMPPSRFSFPAAPRWALADVPADVLSRMCDEFRVEVFRKAGKPDPREDRHAF